MKSKLLIGSIIIVLMLMFSIPVFAVSSSWDFSMSHHYVSGKDNYEFHQLNKGTAYIKGEISQYKIDASSNKRPNTLHATLYRERIGLDKNCGSIQLGSSSDFSFNKKIGNADQDSNAYYLTFYKSDDDHWEADGSGELYN